MRPSRSPPATSATPARAPNTTRIDSVIHSRSNAYFRKKAAPRTRTSVPTYSSRRPPMASSRPLASPADRPSVASGRLWTNEGRSSTRALSDAMGAAPTGMLRSAGVSLGTAGPGAAPDSVASGIGGRITSTGGAGAVGVPSAAAADWVAPSGVSTAWCSAAVSWRRCSSRAASRDRRAATSDDTRSTRTNVTIGRTSVTSSDAEAISRTVTIAMGGRLSRGPTRPAPGPTSGGALCLPCSWAARF